MSDISRHLGQKSPRIENYSPELLVREERQNNRKNLSIVDDSNPGFEGKDIWNLWEVSALQNNGLPVIFLGKLIYPCNNKYIVESKSLKLYFNSFNMTKLGNTREEVKQEHILRVKHDLSQLLETTIEFQLFDVYHSLMKHPLDRTYTRIEDTYSPICLDYKESPKLIKHNTNLRNKDLIQTVYTDLLKSNCKITHQKDEGTLYVYYKGYHAIDESSLLQYIVSFRDVNEFHESTLETIYTRIMTILKPDELMVAALYTRRGGISISPIRANKLELLNSNLINVDVWTQTIRQ